jgi:hypothetical protein
METRLRSTRRHARASLLSIAAVTALLLTVSARTADAGLNFGAGFGAAKRDGPVVANLDVGLAFHLHAEVGVLPFLNVGPYYTHYRLGISDFAFGSAALFNTIGLRARAILPTGDVHPYAYVGAGYTAASYSWPSVTYGGLTVPERNASGHFFEIPIGIGLAYDVAPLFQVFAEAAYRPGVGFAGNAYPDDARPTRGYSFLVGAAINL